MTEDQCDFCGGRPAYTVAGLLACDEHAAFVAASLLAAHDEDEDEEGAAA